MRKITLLIISGLLLIIIAGCGEVETQEKVLRDGSTSVIDDAGKIASEDKSKALDGYNYDEQTGRYINDTTGIWYIVENGQRIIPPEQYFDPDKGIAIEGIGIANRPDDAWELSEILDITVQPGDTLVEIINPYFMNQHFRMNPEWYSKQVLELNNITDPHFIRAGDTLKIPLYVDIGSKQ